MWHKVPQKDILQINLFSYYFYQNCGLNYSWNLASKKPQV